MEEMEALMLMLCSVMAKKERLKAKADGSHFKV
jgi:hypothetical protein